MNIACWHRLLTYPHRAHEDSWGQPEDCTIHPGLSPMQQQPPTNAIPAGFSPSPWFFSIFLSAGLVSFYFQVPTLLQSSRCCQDLSSKRVGSISIFSLVWGLILAYSLLLLRALCCSDGWARISSALSSGMCGETHLVCWDQLLSLSTFRLHTVTRPARLSSGCGAWSSGWIFLTSISEIKWGRRL